MRCQLKKKLGKKAWANKEILVNTFTYKIYLNAQNIRMNNNIYRNIYFYEWSLFSYF